MFYGMDQWHPRPPPSYFGGCPPGFYPPPPPPPPGYFLQCSPGPPFRPPFFPSPSQLRLQQQQHWEEEERYVRNPAYYKTVLCNSWMTGIGCHYKNRCQFAHGPLELRPSPSFLQQQQQQQAPPTPPPPPVIARHPKYKTRVCDKFAQDGFCLFGERCHFIHHGDESTTTTTTGSRSGSLSPATSPVHSDDDSGDAFFHWPTTTMDEQPTKQQGGRLPVFIELTRRSSESPRPFC